MRVPRIQAVDSDMGYWLKYFETNPGERYVSDGDQSTLTVPASKRDKLKPLPQSLKVVER